MTKFDVTYGEDVLNNKHDGIDLILWSILVNTDIEKKDDDQI